jgi:Sulfotransferase family
MYRDIAKNSASLYRIAHALPSLWLAYKLSRLSGAFTESVANSMGLAGRDYRYRLEDDLQLGVVLNCVLMKLYLELRQSDDIEVVGVRYEDLVGDPEESIRRIIEYCHLPLELVTPGLDGLKVDSQRNSLISKSAIGFLPEPPLTPESIARANQMLGKFGLPLIGEPCLLEGTITCGKKRSTSK